MKRGVRDVGFVEVEGQVAALSLGWDFTAEHEWGISGIRQAFGLYDLDERKFKGLDRYIIREVPEDLHCVSSDDLTVLWYSSYHRADELKVPSSLQPHGSTQDLVCAWSEQGFGISGRGEDLRGHIRELHQAFRDKNVAIYRSGSSPGRATARHATVVALDPRAVHAPRAAAHAR